VNLKRTRLGKSGQDISEKKWQSPEQSVETLKAR